jgi:hypothetical protein
MMMPSSSRTFDLMLRATYSIISSGISTPSRYKIFFKIENSFHNLADVTADNPHLKRDNKRCSISCISEEPCQKSRLLVYHFDVSS